MEINMSGYMEKTILKCWDCGEQLTPFEEQKWNDLVDYWGGKMAPDQKPRCRNCYNRRIENRKQAVTNGKGRAVTA